MNYCMVKDGIIENIVLFADDASAEQHGALPSYEGAVIGDVYSPPPPAMTEEEAREKRDRLLAQTDWTQMPDSPLSKELRKAYKVYRQALRDIPSQEGFPANITWPEPPDGTK